MKKLLLTMLFATISVVGFSQNGNLQGKIVDEENQPIEGVVISIQNTKYNAISNSEGTFTLNAVLAGTYTLQTAYVSKEIQKKNIVVQNNKTTSLNLQLISSTQQLNEVTVQATTNRKYTRSTSEFASRQNIPLKDLPQSIQPIPRQIILDQQAFRMNELFKNVAGATDQSDWNYVMMRGFLTNSSNFLVNGQRGGFAGEDQFAQLSFIERAEVLKGPGSVLFGNGAIGGTFNLITKKPKETAYTNANIAVGSFNLLRIQADVNGALNKNKTLLGLLNLAVENGGNFYDGFKNKNVLLTPFFTWKIGQKTEINSMTVLRLANQTTSYATGIPIIGNDPYKAPFNFKYASDDGNYSSKSIQQQFSIKHTINNKWTATAWLNYSKRKDEVFIYAAGGTSPRLDSITRSIQSWKADITGLAINAYVNGSFTTGNIGHDIVIGLDYLNKKDDYPDGFNYYYVSTININKPIYNTFSTKGITPDYYDSDLDQIRTNNTGVYVQDQVSFSKKLKALIGLRYDKYDYRYYSELGTGFGGGVYADTLESSVFVPRFGLTYEINKKLSAYGSYMQGFNPQTTNRASGGPFPPEKGNQIEFGLKGEFLNGRLIPTLAIYQITKTNVLTADLTDPTGNRRAITGEARSRGIEFTLAGNITNEWNILVNYANNKTIVLKDSDKSREGQEFGDTPNNMATFWTTYQLSKLVKGLKIGGGYRYYSDKKVYGIAFKGYGVGDLMLGYEFKKINFQLNANNVFNEKYWFSDSFCGVINFS